LKRGRADLRTPPGAQRQERPSILVVLEPDRIRKQRLVGRAGQRRDGVMLRDAFAPGGAEAVSVCCAAAFDEVASNRRVRDSRMVRPFY
jgi:hypothetical protein